jgi:hypothetical protein
MLSWPDNLKVFEELELRAARPADPRTVQERRVDVDAKLKSLGYVRIDDLGEQQS